MPWVSKDDLKWLRDRVDTLERERQESAARHETIVSALAERHDALLAQESAVWRAAVETCRASYSERVSELERRVDWQSDMLLRRAGTFAVPSKAEAAKALEPPQPPQPPRPSFSFEDVGKAQAIRDEGLRLIAEGATYTDADIEREVKAVTGMTLHDLRLAEEQLAEESQSVS